MKTLYIPCDPGEISDGYHTFNELYQHRCALFLALMASNPSISKHHDGSEWDGTSDFERKSFLKCKNGT